MYIYIKVVDMTLILYFVLFNNMAIVYKAKNIVI